MLQPALVVVDEHRRGDVHGVDQAEAFAHAALTNEFLDLGRDVDEPAPARHFKPEMFSERFQSLMTSSKAEPSERWEQLLRACRIRTG
jgi:hypothetical protein